MLCGFPDKWSLVTVSHFVFHAFPPCALVRRRARRMQRFMKYEIGISSQGAACGDTQGKCEQYHDFTSTLSPGITAVIFD